ncbi:hypothetical protein LCGC14_2333480, partial [marine sediment metagenome]
MMLPAVFLWGAGVLSLTAFIWQASPLLGAGILFASLRTAWMLSWRSVEVLSLMVAVAFMYAIATKMSKSQERLVGWAIVFACVANGLLGILNLFNWYPWLNVKPGFEHWPVGLLSHPNYWGLFLAIGLPVAWALMRSRLSNTTSIVLTVAWFLLVLSSRSRIPALVVLIPVLFIS